MGAALSSRRPTAGLALGDGDQQLLGEFIGHSRAAVDECAAIFRGPDAALDDDQDDDGGVAFPAAEREQEAARDGNGGRRLKNRQLRRGGRRTAYPRRLSPSQFDEIFGMLVADAEPHFAFFQAPGVPPVVIAHQVFCCVALLMSADLRAKVDFVLRLYADAVGHLAPEVKRLLLSDAVASVTRLTGASDPVPSETLAHLERAFFSDEAGKLATARELFDVCFSDARVSGLLHDVHARVLEFVDSERRRQAQRANRHVDAGPSSSKFASSSRRNPSLFSKRSSFKLPAATQDSSVLWTMPTRDFPLLWRRPPPAIFLAEATTFAAALAEMARDNAVVVIVEDNDRCAAAVTIDHFLSYYLHVLRQIESDVAAGAIQRDQLLQRLMHIERAVRVVGAARLSEMLPVVNAELYRDGDRSFFSRLCVDENLPLFHAVLPLASGRRAVAVLASGCSQLLPPDRLKDCQGAVLGTLDALDVLQWIEQDLSILNGKHLLPVAAFPQLFYAPATASTAAVTASEAFAEMAALRVTGISVHASKLLSDDEFRDAFLATHAQLTGVGDSVLPVPMLLTSRLEDVALSPSPAPATAPAPSLPLYRAISPTEPLASAIRAMIEYRARRVVIQRPADGASVGVVRATDVLSLLLREQHVSYQ